MYLNLCSEALRTDSAEQTQWKENGDVSERIWKEKREDEGSAREGGGAACWGIGVYCEWLMSRQGPLDAVAKQWKQPDPSLFPPTVPPPEWDFRNFPVGSPTTSPGAETVEELLVSHRRGLPGFLHPVHLTVSFICLEQSVLPQNVHAHLPCPFPPLTAQHLHPDHTFLPLLLTFSSPAAAALFFFFFFCWTQSDPCWRMINSQAVMATSSSSPGDIDRWNLPGVGCTVTDPLSRGHICPPLSIPVWEVAPVSRWVRSPWFSGLRGVSEPPTRRAVRERLEL